MSASCLLALPPCAEDESLSDPGSCLLSEALTGRRLIVLADDDRAMRAFLVQALEDEGHEVLGASDGAELLERIDWFRVCGREPDLVVSDVRMPGVGGLELLETLRASRTAAPVILITAFGDRALHERAERLGAARVLDKPFDLDELRRTVTEVLEGTRR
jgi:CheY-like chemotaxis protein